MTVTPDPPPPALQEATKNSTNTWQQHLESLFVHAKDRFPDVVWDLIGDEDYKVKDPEEVWGHKAIVYARAPPSFQARYFSFRPAPVASPLPYASSPIGTFPAHSALSLSQSLALEIPGVSRSPSPYLRVASPSPSTTPGGILRLTTSINPALFSNELEYLYTGKGFGAAFEFLFDTSESREEGDAEENRIDKLRKDLVFMWRSRLYSDVRISLSGRFSSSNHEDTTAIFSSHRFILISRSPYFHDALVSWPKTSSYVDKDEPLTLTLPSPPFTPASLHFTLGFIYTGTLVFSHRTYDLETAFHIMRSANYLSLQTLYDEVQARIVQEMAHGLFHTFLEFTEYERVTGGKWGIGGCRCRQCARRAPRILEFALGEDVKNKYLERGARRALVGIFGEGWCTSDYAGLDPKIRESVIKGVGKRTTPLNVFALLFAANRAISKLATVVDPWGSISKDDVLKVRKGIDECLCVRAEECFGEGGGGEEWEDIMTSGGDRFNDAEKVEWILDGVKRGLTEKNAPMVYQVIVSSILLRPHATETDATMLSSTSHVRVQVEECRMELVKWMKRRWVGIRQDGGFDALEGWSLKEISGEIDVPVDDLISPDPNASSRNMSLPPYSGPRPSLIVGDGESDVGSLRASVLSRNMTRNVTPTASSAASVRSVARSTVSTTPRAVPLKRNQPPPGPRPDSKLTPSSSSVSTTSTIEGRKTPTPTPIPTPTPPPAAEDRKTPTPTPPIPTTTTTTGPTTTRRVVSRTTTPNTERPKSAAPSVSSVKSHASTIRKSSTTSKSTPISKPTPLAKTPPTATAGPSTLRPPSSTGTIPRRPMSNVRPSSAVSDASTSFKTAEWDRRTSVASNLSIKNTAAKAASIRNSATTPTMLSRSRRTSDASVTSTISNVPRTVKRPPVPPVDSTKLGPIAAKRSPATSLKNSTSTTSLRSTTSTTNTAVSKKVAPIKNIPEKKPPLPTPKSNGRATAATAASTLKGKGRAGTLASESSTTSSGSESTARGTLKRKGSADTITRSTTTKARLNGPLPISPRGATLDIGIPCIVSSKRKRFKAFARYIGEVEGETGPWVGVEVPMGDSLTLEGPQWNDGTWGGIRYFEMGSGGSEFDYGDDRATRRRRVDWVNNIGKTKGLKRQGDQLSVERAKRLRSASPVTSDLSNSESRGLFVRPQQVLYVVDAVGADL